MNVFETQTLSVSSNGTLPNVPFAVIKDHILGRDYSLSIAFVGPKKAQSLNIAHRNKDYIPNTLSFSLSDTSGEIILCMSILKQQYKKFDMDFHTYLIFILIHSMLHLKGMEHSSTMEAEEEKLLTFFTIHK